MNRKTLLLVLLKLFGFSYSARILGVIPTPSYSHQIVYQPIWQQLSQRGHEVVVLTTDPLNDASLTNLTEIDLSFTYEMKDELMDTLRKIEITPYRVFKMIAEYAAKMTRMQLEHPNFQNFLNNNDEHFDLVIVEALFPVYGALAQKFKCPLIGASSFEPWNEWLSAMGNPLSPAAFPNPNLPFLKDLSFLERIMVSLYQFVAVPLRSYFFDYMSDDLVREFFGKDYSPASQFYSNLDLYFSYVNPVLKPSGPRLDTVIEFGGGIHIKPPKPLPDDIKSFLDESKNGVVYFSFGSNVPDFVIPQESKDIFVETLGELPYDVLWKFNLDDDVKLPSNVKLVKWVPQQDILRHPKIKLFITQGGLQSFEEALQNHIPLIGFPFHADQARNLKLVEHYNIGTYFDVESFEKEHFKNAILKIAGDPTYKARMKELAALSKDQPMNSLETVIWWTEYVIRNKGAKHLRSVVANMPFYEYYLLDVIGFGLVVLSVFLYLSFKIFQLLIRCCCTTKKNKIKTQ